jgi:hypothetical protein
MIPIRSAFVWQGSTSGSPLSEPTGTSIPRSGRTGASYCPSGFREVDRTDRLCTMDFQSVVNVIRLPTGWKPDLPARGLTDTRHDTLADAIAQAEWEYAGTEQNWDIVS